MLVDKGEEDKVEGTHGLQMLDGSPLARLPTMPRFDIVKFSLQSRLWITIILNYYQSAQVDIVKFP